MSQTSVVMPQGLVDLADSDVAKKTLNRRPRAEKKLSFGSVMAEASNEHDKEMPLVLRPEHFESWRAFVSCFTLEVGACVLLCGPAYYYSVHWTEWAFALIWHLTLWVIPHLVVHRKKTPANMLVFTVCALIIALQPHMDICKRVAFLGAIHGAASIMVVIRMCQFYAYNDCEEYRAWKGLRRMFFISSWGWHDMSDRCVVYRGPGYLMPEALRLVKWFSVLAACIAFEMAWGKHIPQGRDLYVHFGARWGAGFFLILAWFNVMDAMVRSLHFWCDGHEIRSLCQDPWSATTLKEFWGKRWNLPIQELLTKGVYLPINRLKWLPMRKVIGKVMVFVVSGLGHTYAVSCGGEPWLHLAAMCAFFLWLVAWLD